jgi:DNA end-binding protein Ku
MAGALWSGMLSFGLVSIPVRPVSGRRGTQPAFHEFLKNTRDRIPCQRVNQRTGQEVPHSDVVKDADIGASYVLLGQEELDSIAPGRSRLLDIRIFVDPEIDLIYFSKGYFLGPGMTRPR